MKDSGLGQIEISPHAIMDLASQVVLECYGVVNVVSKDLASDIIERLPFDNHQRGVDVHIENDQIVIDLYVVIEYGTRIITVARNIQSAVKYSLEKALGMPVAAVNVHVQDLRISAD
jgi:uncharacterized alkaline shock family protein YloU